MKDRNENRPGYKNTKVGWIPETWGCEPFTHVFKRAAESVIPEATKSYQEIGVRSHGKGIFHKPPVTGDLLGEKRVFKCQPGSLIFNIVFAWEQAVAVVSDNEKDMIASHRFPMYRGKKGQAFEPFFMWHFKTPRGKYDLTLASPGGAGRNKTLGQRELDYLFIPKPPLPEQKKVAEVLSCWNKGIQTLKLLIDEKKLQKKGLMQQLLVGNKRLPEFVEDWTAVELREIVKRTEPYEKLEAEKSYQLVSVRRDAKGIFNRGAMLRENISYDKMAQLKRYNLVISKRQVSHGAYGLAEKQHAGCFVSSEYVILEPTGKKVYMPFLKWITRQPIMWHKGYVSSNGVHIEKLILDPEHFLKHTILLPTYDEQKAIVEVLDAADEEIRILEEQLKALYEQKKGLMQKLLTGEVRHPDFRK